MEQDLQKKLDQIIIHLNSINNSNRLSWKSVFRHFFLGIATAFGATVGFALILAILGYLIVSLGGIPIVGGWFTDLGQFLQSSRMK